MFIYLQCQKQIEKPQKRFFQRSEFLSILSSSWWHFRGIENIKKINNWTHDPQKKINRGRTSLNSKETVLGWCGIWINWVKYSEKNTNYGAHQFIIKYLLIIDYLNFLKDLTGSNTIFYICPKNIKWFNTFFAEKRRVKCKKLHFISKKKVCVLSFIVENNEWIKKLLRRNVWLKMLYFNTYLFF